MEEEFFVENACTCTVSFSGEIWRHDV